MEVRKEFFNPDKSKSKWFLSPNSDKADEIYFYKFRVHFLFIWRSDKNRILSFLGRDEPKL